MAKGFKAQPMRYQVTFEDSDLDGLECVFRGMPLGEFIELVRLGDLLATREGRTPENIEAQYVRLSELLLSWNLEDDDDKPVKPAYEALQALDFRYVQQIMRGYMRAFTAVPKASNGDSPSGETSPEQSLQLEMSSPNPPS